MVNRKRIGIIYNYTEEWIAGAYYYLNIIKALKTLPDKKKPKIIIIYQSEDGLNLVKEINYPVLEFVHKSQKIHVIKRAVNKLGRGIGTKQIFEPIFYKTKIDYAYPGSLLGLKKTYRWIPDFQEDYYPEFFSKELVKYRKDYQQNISESNDSVVFSSYDAMNDFKRLYPKYSCELKVLQFASVLSYEYQNIPIKELLLKYEIKKRYFFAPNQFWQHKNHITILEALTELKKKNNIDFQVVMSGNPNDYRNKDHYQTLEKYVLDNSIGDCVRFIGFIDRNEQLQLMNHSLAIIQPSLFEGWSTVLEEAKAMSKYVILSDLPVHKEQLNFNCSFFERNSPLSLAENISNFLKGNVVHIEPVDYKKNINKFALDFVSLFED